jgi:hypothetical protein
MARDLIAEWQEYFDNALQPIGVRAKVPVLGQSSNEYAQDSCETLASRLPQNHELSKVEYRELHGKALTNMAQTLIEAVKADRVNPANFAPGEMRMVKKIHPQTGREMIEWYGQQSFVKQMGTPGRRVLSFGVVRENLANYNRGNERTRGG